MNDYEMIWQFLRQFFNYEHYHIAIENIRKALAIDSTYRKKWEQIVSVIQNQKLLLEEPLALVHDGANQVLDENSDEEAYYWLY